MYLNAKEAHVLWTPTEEKMFAEHLLFSSERGLDANSDALKSIMVNLGLVQAEQN